MSLFLSLAAVYVFGEAADWWDIYDGADPARGDEYAFCVSLVLLVLAFIAWGVEQIRDAIKERNE